MKAGGAAVAAVSGVGSGAGGCRRKHCQCSTIAVKKEHLL